MTHRNCYWSAQKPHQQSYTIIPREYNIGIGDSLAPEFSRYKNGNRSNCKIKNGIFLAFSHIIMVENNTFYQDICSNVYIQLYIILQSIQNVYAYQIVYAHLTPIVEKQFALALNHLQRRNTLCGFSSKCIFMNWSIFNDNYLIVFVYNHNWCFTFMNWHLWLIFGENKYLQKITVFHVLFSKKHVLIKSRLNTL